MVLPKLSLSVCLSPTRSLLDSSSQSAVQLTGDKRADADIMAFIKARQNLLQARGEFFSVGPVL